MYLFIDTETTGLPKGGVQPRIVSIAWIVADTPTRHQSYRYMVVRPDGFQIPADATRIHGITTERANREGVALALALEGLALDIGTHRPARVVAHNLGFDRPIIDTEYQRLGKRSALTGLNGVCTVRLSKNRWPDQRATLDEVHRRLFGTALDAAHNAHADVLACMRIFFALNGTSSANSSTVGDTLRDNDETLDAEELIERVLDWASDRVSFDTSFVESLQMQIEQRGRLTPKQIGALENIVARFNIP